MKKVTITAIVSKDVNQNQLKDWVKSCPFSLEGQQTVTWENLPDPEPVKAEEPQGCVIDSTGECEACQ